eukprot:6211402-Pleurochrysis_carterae.AAC.1
MSHRQGTDSILLQHVAAGSSRCESHATSSPRAQAHCRTAAGLDGATLDGGTLDVRKEEKRNCLTRRELVGKIGFAMTRMHCETSSPRRCRGPAELASARCMRRMRPPSCCQQMHAASCMQSIPRAHAHM